MVKFYNYCSWIIVVQVTKECECWLANGFGLFGGENLKGRLHYDVEVFLVQADVDQLAHVLK